MRAAVSPKPLAEDVAGSMKRGLADEGNQQTGVVVIGVRSTYVYDGVSGRCGRYGGGGGKSVEGKRGGTRPWTAV